MPVAKITSKGQITVPKEVRDRLGVKPGDSLEFALEGDEWKVRRQKRRSIAEFRGMFKTENTLPFKVERQLAWDAMTERLWKPYVKRDE